MNYNYPVPTYKKSIFLRSIFRDILGTTEDFSQNNQNQEKQEEPILQIDNSTFYNSLLSNEECKVIEQMRKKQNTFEKELANFEVPETAESAPQSIPSSKKK